uniref:Uncharacterized protein n=1 Tax=Arundo donax TaxID=35708 RepID=A0A0A9HH15_ARUDO
MLNLWCKRLRKYDSENWEELIAMLI